MAHKQVAYMLLHEGVQNGLQSCLNRAIKLQLNVAEHFLESLGAVCALSCSVPAELLLL